MGLMAEIRLEVFIMVLTETFHEMKSMEASR